MWRIGVIRSSGLNTNHLSRLDGLDRGQGRWNQGNQIFERVAPGAKYDDAQTPLRDVLLELKAVIAGQEHREPSRLGLAEQYTILETCPRFLLDSANVVADKERRELPR